MRLRKLQLLSTDEIVHSTRFRLGPLEIPNMLTLWFDAVNTKDVNALVEFLKENYQLLPYTAQFSGYQGEPCTDYHVEYANNTLLVHGVPGNITRLYEELIEQRESKHEQMPRLLFKRPSSLAEYDEAIRDYVNRSGEYIGKRQNLDTRIELLEEIIKKASSAILSVFNDTDPCHPLLNIGTDDMPSDYSKQKNPNCPAFESALVKVMFLPAERKLLKSFAGLLFERDCIYETPRHSEVLRGIVEETIKHYSGIALFEYQQDKT